MNDREFDEWCAEKEGCWADKEKGIVADDWPQQIDEEGCPYHVLPQYHTDLEAMLRVVGEVVKDAYRTNGMRFCLDLVPSGKVWYAEFECLEKVSNYKYIEKRGRTPEQVIRKALEAVAEEEG